MLQQAVNNVYAAATTQTKTQLITLPPLAAAVKKKKGVSRRPVIKIVAPDATAP